MTLMIFITVGFVAGFTLIFLSKFILAGLLQRKAGYYDDQYDLIESEAFESYQGGEDHV
ncbi:MAG: hypothetical protein IKK48_02315 [Firmicutes bacterium]|nr:hypothetical protein [Bacillota bacterium]